MKRAFWDLIRSDLEASPQRFTHVIKLIEEIRDRLCWCCPRQSSTIHGVIDISLLQQMFNNDAFDAHEFAKVCFFIMNTLQSYCSLDHKPKVDEFCNEQAELLKNDIKYSDWIPTFFEGVHGHIDIIEDQIRQFRQKVTKDS